MGLKLIVLSRRQLIDGACFRHTSLKHNHVFDVLLRWRTRQSLLEDLGVQFDNITLVLFKLEWALLSVAEVDLAKVQVLKFILLKSLCSFGVLMILKRCGSSSFNLPSLGRSCGLGPQG